MFTDAPPSGVNQGLGSQAPLLHCGVWNTLWAAFLTTRPGSALLAGTLTASGAFAGAGHLSLRGAAAGFGMTTLTMFGFVVNDIFDYSKDRAAEIQRPLATGKLSTKIAKWLAIIALLCSSITWVWVGAAPMLLLLVSLLLVLYSPFARRYAMFKGIYVAVLCCAPLYYAGLISGRRYSWLTYISLAIFVFGREALMDADELPGDSKFGMKTIAAILGQYQCMCLGLGLMIVASGASAVAVHGRIAMSMGLFALAALAGVFVWPRLNQGRRISFSRVAMLLGSMALACGGFAPSG